MLNSVVRALACPHVRTNSSGAEGRTTTIGLMRPATMWRDTVLVQRSRRVRYARHVHRDGPQHGRRWIGPTRRSGERLWPKNAVAEARVRMIVPLSALKQVYVCVCVCDAICSRLHAGIDRVLPIPCRCRVVALSGTQPMDSAQVWVGSRIRFGPMGCAVAVWPSLASGPLRCHAHSALPSVSRAPRR